MNFTEAFFLGWAIAISSFSVTILAFNYIFPVNNQKKIQDSDSDSDSDDEIFENSGKDEVKQLKTRKLTEEDLELISKQSIEIETPQGDIILKYNPNEKGFFYYANFNVQYKTLDAAARQFILKYDCKELYHYIDFDSVSDISDNDSPKQQQVINEYSDSDSTPELNDDDDEDDENDDDEDECKGKAECDEDECDEDKCKGKVEYKKDDECEVGRIEEADEVCDGCEKDEDEEEEHHDVFANLKNYKKDEIKKDDDGAIIEEKKINKFLYKGKIDEYRKKEVQTDKIMKEVSYKDFKDKKLD